MTPLEILAEHTAVTSSLGALYGRLLALQPEIADLVSAVEDPPAPVPGPVEPPAPVPSDPPAPIPPVDVALHVEPINRSRQVHFCDWNPTISYSRYESLNPWVGDKPIQVKCIRGCNGSGTPWLPAKRYTLILNGVITAATADVAENAKTFAFTVKPSDHPPGWIHAKIAGLTDGESCPAFFFFYYEPGMTMPVKMPVVSGSYSLSKRAEHLWRAAPAEYKPRIAPLPRREYVMDGTLSLKNWRVDLLVPEDTGDIYMPNVNVDGIVSTYNKQAYFFDDLTGAFDRMPALDGPRGVGTITMATHIEPGMGTQTADPSSQIRDNVYVCEPKRICVVDYSGAVRTLAGTRNVGIASYMGDKIGRTEEEVGDWSAVPERLRGFLELWRFVFEPDSLGIDTSAASIPSEDNRQPHKGNPYGYATDVQRGCVYKIEFDGKSHATPAKISVFAELQGAFHVIVWKDEVIVSQQDLNRVIALHKDGSFKRTIIERDPNLPGDANLASKGYRKMWGSGTVEQQQAQPILGPEGLCILDDVLYVGSRVQSQFRRVHLVTGERFPHIDVKTNNNSHFLVGAVDDGTFGPKGTLYVASWSNTYNMTGQMSAILPDGSLWNFASALPFAIDAYGSSVAVARGALWTGSAHIGLRRHFRGTPLDKARIGRGKAVYEALEGDFRWGRDGYYMHESDPLPWGQNPDMDYYFEAAGHIKPEAVA